MYIFFPRQGFLLGIVREHKFLFHENIDPDLACLENDIPTILNSDWEDYIITVQKDLPFYWDRNFFNGLHPLTKEKLPYVYLQIKHKYSFWKENIGIFFNYTHNKLFYPLFSIPYFISNQEYKVNQIYNRYKGGSGILGNDKILPINKLFTDNNFKGKVGIIYNKNDILSFRLEKFYDNYLYVPQNAENILKTDYGYNVFDDRIYKDGRIEKIK